MMMLGVKEEGQMRRASRSNDVGSRTREDQGQQGRVEGSGEVWGGPGQGMAGTHSATRKGTWEFGDGARMEGGRTPPGDHQGVGPESTRSSSGRRLVEQMRGRS